MTESSSLLPVKDVYEISKELFGYGYDVIGFLFPEIPSKIIARRAKNLITVMRSAQKILDEAGLKPEERNAVSLKLGLPIIEKASLEEDPTLQELWANLLANALNPNHSDKVRSIFIDIIQSLSAFDVLILNAFHISRHPLITRPRNVVQVYTKEGYKSYPYEKIDASLSVLKALNLLTDVGQWELDPFSILRNPRLSELNRLDKILQKTDTHLTPLGVLFIDACIKDASGSRAETSD